MKGSGEEFAVVVVILVLVLGLAVGAINGAAGGASRRVPGHHRHARHVLRVGGCRAPGPQQPRRWRGRAGSSDLVDGSCRQRSGCPRRCCSCWSCVGVVWMPLRRSRLGLSMYAVGSDRLAALRSGVDVSRTKVAAYAHHRAVRGDGRSRADHDHRHRLAGARAPTRSTAWPPIVLGGVSLAGGRGGMLGPIAAAFILRLIRAEPGLPGRGPELQHGHPGRHPGHRGHDRRASRAAAVSGHERRTGHRPAVAPPMPARRRQLAAALP